MTRITQLFFLTLTLLSVLAQQPCPFDCLTCDPVTNKCASCADGFRLSNGNCHLYSCDRAEAHIGKDNTGADDIRDATWTVISADSSTLTVDIEVFVPPRFECDKVGHALVDALSWAAWLNTSSCPNGDAYCGPSQVQWEPVLILGREQDTDEGYLELPVADATQTACKSAYRNADSLTITDLKTQSGSLVTSWDPISSKAIVRVALFAITDVFDTAYCIDEDDFGTVGGPYEYWSREEFNNGDDIAYTFDLTLCYVDSIGQSVCPFSSAVYSMTIDQVTENVAVTAGTVELITGPQCELYIRSAQIRYSGQMSERDAQGEFEISVTCQGTDYVPDIIKIHHCKCIGNDPDDCAIYEEESSCTTEDCTVSALFKSTSFNASLEDFLSGDCPTTDYLDGGNMIVEIGVDESDCVYTPDCIEISDITLFGSAPLDATDDEETLAGMFNNSHGVFAGIMLSNELGVPSGEEDYFHQFNRTYLDFGTVRRIVSADQRNSFVMCAMMQPTDHPRRESLAPAAIGHEYKIGIREVDFTVTWEDPAKPQTEIRMSDLLAGQVQWPSQWVWESQDESSIRRQVLSRRANRADAPCGNNICEVSPMQDHVFGREDWDHIRDNIDCVGISPFYLYSLLTLNDSRAIPTSVQANLTVFHEYRGKVQNGGRRLLDDSKDVRQLLQNDFDQTSPVFGQGTDSQIQTGGMAWGGESIDKTEVDEIEEDESSTPFIPILPIAIGLLAAGSCCFIFAGLTVWRRRHRTCAQCQKWLYYTKFTRDEIKFSGPKARCIDCIKKESFDMVVTLSPRFKETPCPPQTKKVVYDI